MKSIRRLGADNQLVAKKEMEELRKIELEKEEKKKNAKGVKTFAEVVASPP